MTRSLDSLSFHSGLVFFPAPSFFGYVDVEIHQPLQPYPRVELLSMNYGRNKLFHFAASSSTSIIRPVTTFLTLCDYYAALP
ncbi:hypothetical protein DTO166G4_8890 [Paecilomyces variotii]|nr:hypothetical protein DTO166G4_8890 [Paecilomyces variotii]KAJ9222085.1 hypothetical protein DTO169C6_5536 [Paecilomyces variotii]KAJ9236564.1 hypothetical protein DTO166G5_4029 [Paecilomyces variotii]KAJ9320581.1 hypothetical protein DTO027B3_8432 [Paecilomyces variotii]KAJ9333143.1 hypothetical protein DTO027B5_5051 [Paecilomyces variotii]